MENNRYAPPVSSIQGTPELVRENPRDGFRDLSGITGKLSILLLIGLGAKILAFVPLVMQVNLLSHSYTKTELATRAAVIGLGNIVLYLGTVVVFGRWIYLAQRNLPELGAQQLRFTPGSSVGCFFIPLLNLWAPCQAMNQLVRASRDPRTWHLEDTPAVIIIWWALWLIAQLLGNVVLRRAIAQTAAPYPGATQLNVVLAGVGVPLYLLAWVIVRRVSHDQAQTHAQQATLGQTAAYESA